MIACGFPRALISPLADDQVIGRQQVCRWPVWLMPSQGICSSASEMFSRASACLFEQAGIEVVAVEQFVEFGAVSFRQSGSTADITFGDLQQLN